MIRPGKIPTHSFTDSYQGRRRNRDRKLAREKAARVLPDFLAYAARKRDPVLRSVDEITRAAREPFPERPRSVTRALRESRNLGPWPQEWEHEDHADDDPAEQPPERRGWLIELPAPRVRTHCEACAVAEACRADAVSGRVLRCAS